MCRSSRLTAFVLAVAFAGAALPPGEAAAQLYGFPSAVGVLDDGFGVLPPALPAAPPLLPPPPAGLADGFGPQPSVPRSLPCPLVIRVGRGLRHAARTRVVSGRPGCS